VRPLLFEVRFPARQPLGGGRRSPTDCPRVVAEPCGPVTGSTDRRLILAAISDCARRPDPIAWSRRPRAAGERRHEVRTPHAVVTMLRDRGSIVSAESLELPRLASLPPGTQCIRRDARTPLVVRPMQAVSESPRCAPRSVLPLTPSS
jgi:hypothetical protein